MSGPCLDDLPETDAVQLAALGFEYSCFYECWEVRA